MTTNEILLVEKQIIKPSHSYYKELDHLCFLSKNLYNVALYEIRQHYFETKKYKSFLIKQNILEIKTKLILELCLLKYLIIPSN